MFSKNRRRAAKKAVDAAVHLALNYVSNCGETSESLCLLLRYVRSRSNLLSTEADWLKLVVVDGRLDAADDWIVARIAADDIVISADIPLAARCLEKGAIVLDMRGGVFTEDRIGEALASREILGQLRERGTISGGPAAFTQQDRSRFLQRLDQAIQAIRRKR